MTTLITGGNGWLPSFVLRRLADSGEHVISYDLMEPDTLLHDFLGDARANVVFESGDVTDRDRLRAVAEMHQVDSIISAAAITPRIDRERREPERILEVNVGGVVNALEVARSLPGFRRFVQISSASVFGDVPGVPVLDEMSPTNATNLYGITKLAGERIALRYGELFGLDVVAVRPSNVFGPMERVTPGYSGATELREMLRIYFAGEPITVNALDANYRDWIFADDVAEGIVLAWGLKGRHVQKVFNLASDEQQSVGDVLAAFRLAFPNLVYRVASRDAANFPVDSEGPWPMPTGQLARDVLGWQPRTSFADGMRQYLAWIETNGPQ